MLYLVTFLIVLSGCASESLNKEDSKKIAMTAIDEAAGCVFHMAEALSNSDGKPTDIANASLGGCSNEIANMRLKMSDNLYDTSNSYNDYKVPYAVNDICERKQEYWRQQIIKMVLEKRLKKSKGGREPNRTATH